MELTEGHKAAILEMFANGVSIRDLAQWYRVDQETIREVLRPHVKIRWEPERVRRATRKTE
jgi:hypothetical protein